MHGFSARTTHAVCPPHPHPQTHKLTSNLPATRRARATRDISSRSSPRKKAQSPAGEVMRGRPSPNDALSSAGCRGSRGLFCSAHRQGRDGWFGVAGEQALPSALHTMWHSSVGLRAL